MGCLSLFYTIANLLPSIQRRIKVDDLYTFHGIYRYFYGFNLRAYTACGYTPPLVGILLTDVCHPSDICGIAPNLPGFIGAVGHSVPIAATRIYYCAFFVGFGTSALVYLLLVKIFPIDVPTEEDNLTVTVGITKSSIDRVNERDSSYSEKDSASKDGEYVTGYVSPV